MRIGAAIEATERGLAVSREAWGDPDKIVRSLQKPAPYDSEDWSAGYGVAVGPMDFTQADLEADDWFVVAAVN